MTVCIAALCNEGKACIVGADREITVPALSLEFEHQEKKIETLNKGCVVMSSGDALLAAEVVEKTRAKLAALANPMVQQVAEALRSTYMPLHLERAEQVILHPRGLNLREFKERGAQQLPPQAYLNIDQLLFNFGIGVVEFHVAGVDGTGGHIFRVHYSGVAGGSWLEWCDKLGYRAIGTGGPHATIFLSMEGQHRGQGVAETLYNVYCAKRTAEVAPGVGAATDLATIIPEKIEFVNEQRLGKLAALREKHQQQKVTREEVEGI